MNIIIIGNGITGTTCARHIRKKNQSANISIISSETDHFYSRTALMYIYMGHMKYEHIKPYDDSFWIKNRINLIKASVTNLNTDNTISLDNGLTLSYDKLIIATGSKPKKIGWLGESLDGVQGLYSIQDLERMEKNTRGITTAIIVGGGLIGVEMAEMLSSRKIDVTMLVRENAYWSSVLPQEEAQLLGRQITDHGIKLLFNTNLKEIIPNEQGAVKAILTDSEETIPCSFLGLTIGVEPNIDFLKNSSIDLDRGILINEYFETNITNVYAAGDCAQFRKPKSGAPPVEQLWYTGKMQAETLAKTICSNKTSYDRGIWFNSAKFFDIEYQTYGQVLPKIKEEQESFYWEHPKGKHAFRANYNKSDQSIIGFNFIGIRFRQVIAEEWIREQKTIEYVIENLDKGWFDPEFSKPFYLEIIKYYKNQLQN